MKSNKRKLAIKHTNPMNQDCIFCQLAEGNGKSHKVYEDEYTFAFLDMHPINPGHVLVIPKQHVANFFELEDGIYSKLMLSAKKIAKMVNKFAKPKKVGLLAAGFDVPHTHIHVVPIHNYHDLTSKSLLEGKRATPSNEELAKVAEELTE